MKKILETATVLLVGLALSGCGAWHDQYRTRDLGNQTEWQSDEQARKTNTLSYEAYGPLINTSSGEWSLKFKQSYRVDEYGYHAYQTQHRRVKDANLNPFALLGCFMEMSFKRCKARQKSWRDKGDEQQINYEPTGKSVVKNDGKLEGQYEGMVHLTGYDGQGKAMEAKPVKVTLKNSKVRFPLKTELQALPKRPVRAAVKFVAADLAGHAIDYTSKVPESLITGTKLYAEKWLPQNEQKILYMTQVRDAMRAEEWSTAWTAFNKLWDLDFEKPLSFRYRYGLVLHKAGAPEKAAKYLKRYMREAGKGAKYYEAAKAMLNE